MKTAQPSESKETSTKINGDVNPPLDPVNIFLSDTNLYYDLFFAAEDESLSIKQLQNLPFVKNKKLFLLGLFENLLWNKNLKHKLVYTDIIDRFSEESKEFIPLVFAPTISDKNEFRSVFCTLVYTAYNEKDKINKKSLNDLIDNLILNNPNINFLPDPLFECYINEIFLYCIKNLSLSAQVFLDNYGSRLCRIQIAYEALDNSIANADFDLTKKLINSGFYKILTLPQKLNIIKKLSLSKEGVIQEKKEDENVKTSGDENEHDNKPVPVDSESKRNSYDFDSRIDNIVKRNSSEDLIHEASEPEKDIENCIFSILANHTLSNEEIHLLPMSFQPSNVLSNDVAEEKTGTEFQKKLLAFCKITTDLEQQKKLIISYIFKTFEACKTVEEILNLKNELENIVIHKPELAILWQNPSWKLYSSYQWKFWDENIRYVSDTWYHLIGFIKLQALSVYFENYIDKDDSEPSSELLEFLDQRRILAGRQTDEQDFRSASHLLLDQHASENGKNLGRTESQVLLQIESTKEKLFPINKQVIFDSNNLEKQNKDQPENNDEHKDHETILKEKLSNLTIDNILNSDALQDIKALVDGNVFSNADSYFWNTLKIFATPLVLCCSQFFYFRRFYHNNSLYNYEEKYRLFNEILITIIQNTESKIRNKIFVNLGISGVRCIDEILIIAATDNNFPLLQVLVETAPDLVANSTVWEGCIEQLMKKFPQEDISPCLKILLQSGNGKDDEIEAKLLQQCLESNPLSGNHINCAFTVMGFGKAKPTEDLQRIWRNILDQDKNLGNSDFAVFELLVERASNASDERRESLGMVWLVHTLNNILTKRDLETAIKEILSLYNEMRAKIKFESENKSLQTDSNFKKLYARHSLFCSRKWDFRDFAQPDLHIPLEVSDYFKDMLKVMKTALLISYKKIPPNQRNNLPDREMAIFFNQNRGNYFWSDTTKSMTAYTQIFNNTHTAEQLLQDEVNKTHGILAKYGKDLIFENELLLDMRCLQIFQK